ncbi:MAG: hypothetical protein WC450_10430 [Candidatus Omnitrophota bacterium]|jgi:hypothetical protein
MKKVFMVLGVLLLTGIVMTNTSAVYAQEEEMEEYSWGTVAEISSDQIVIVEYNYETEEEQNETYMIAPDVELLGISALSEIKVGDAVEFRYSMQGDKKVILAIGLDKSVMEESPTDVLSE